LRQLQEKACCKAGFFNPGAPGGGMYSKEDYLKNFSLTDSDTLLDRLAHSELTHEARDAIRQILTERGCSLPNIVVADISDETVLAQAMKIKNGDCPLCQCRKSAVELRTEHWIWSAIFVTRLGYRRALMCRDCGRSRNLKALGWCVLLGWWGVPFGLLVTPYKIFANLGEFLRKDKPQPSDALRDLVRTRLAELARPRV
jgi:hypothetical protein